MDNLNYELKGKTISDVRTSPTILGQYQNIKMIFDDGSEIMFGCSAQEGHYMVRSRLVQASEISSHNSFISIIAGRDIRGCHLGESGRGSLI